MLTRRSSCRKVESKDGGKGDGSDEMRPVEELSIDSEDSESGRVKPQALAESSSSRIDRTSTDMHASDHLSPVTSGNRKVEG